jgi:hypothetical protein
MIQKIMLLNFLAIHADEESQLISDVFLPLPLNHPEECLAPFQDFLRALNFHIY